jgi:hypothetical protein
VSVQDFTLWDNGAPLIVINGSYEFSIWDNDAPLIEQDEAGTADERRRAMIF